jgi:hypothetical protein
VSARRALGWIAIAASLALVAAGAAVGHERAREREASPLPSALSTGPGGLAAARLFLSATGRSALRFDARDARPPPGAVVVLAAPAAELDDAEVGALLDHVYAGGTLVWMAGAARQPALERRLGLRARAAPGFRIAVPLAPHPLLAGLLLPVGAGSVDPEAPGALPVIAVGAEVAGVSVRAGSGEVLVLSGPEPLTNERLGDAGAISFLVRLAARGPIVFNERWLVARGAPAPASTRAIAAAALQGLLALAVWLLARSRRLGAIRPSPPEARGRTARDYLASLAALYGRAGAEEEIARAAWRRARRALERRAGIPARLAGEDAAARLTRRSPAAAEALRRGEAALRSGRGALLATYRAADELARAVGTS